MIIFLRGISTILLFLGYCGTVICSKAPLSNLSAREYENNTVINDTILPKLPPFRINIRRGLNKARTILKSDGLPLLLSIRNQAMPPYSPTSMIEAFTAIDMDILNLTRMIPKRGTAYSFFGEDEWGDWENEVMFPIDASDKTVARAFDIQRLEIGDTEAREMLRKRGLNGPWLAYEVCHGLSSQYVVYAFERSSDETGSRIFDTVDTNGHYILFNTKGPAFCPQPELRKKTSISGTPSNSSSDSVYNISSAQPSGWDQHPAGNGTAEEFPVS